MSIKLEGFDEMKKKLNQIQENAKELEGTSTVSFEDLFTPQFMSEYTEHSSMEDLFNSGGFEINSAEDFENLPEEDLDAHVAKTTKFSTWQEMLGKATEVYVVKQLGF